MVDENSIPTTKEEKPVTNRYNIVIGIFLATFNVGLVVTTFGVFFKPMSIDFGWTRAATSGAFSLSTMMSGVVGIIAGRLADRFNPRLVILTCGLVTGLAYLMLSQMTNLWQLYFYYGILVGAGLAVIVPASSLVVRWFKRQRGLMTGIALSGAAFSSIFSPYLATWLISRFSWHISYLVIGSLCLIFLGIAAFFLLRSYKGGSPEDEKTSRAEVPDTVKPISFRETVRSWTFWCLALIYFCFHFTINVIMVHMVPHATDIGISPLLAASILMIANGANVIGSFGLGSIRR